ncbi:MAG: PilZ domain-containing protein [Candidatus Acidiferrales bacterium]
MGHRTEVRIAKRVPVLVHGTDGRGSPFTDTAQVHDISGSGACLSGLNGIGVPGTKVDIEYQGRKARFRIQWVGKPGTPQANRVGLRCLEPGNYIWGEHLPEWAEDTFDPNAIEVPTHAPAILISNNGAPIGGTSKELRQFPRQSCRIESLIAMEGTTMNVPAKVTDISFSGCYVEMLSPLPVDTLIELTLNPGDTTLHVHGKVRYSQMGMGMGIAFTGASPEDFEKLRKLAPPGIGASVANAPAPAPVQPLSPARPRTPPQPDPTAAREVTAPGIPPARPATTSDALEAVVRVLFRKGILSRSELTEELEKLLISKS